jgi:hypothetical protein
MLFSKRFGILIPLIVVIGNLIPFIFEFLPFLLIEDDIEDDYYNFYLMKMSFFMIVAGGNIIGSLLIGLMIDRVGY